jgi:hypothetical protein
LPRTREDGHRSEEQGNSKPQEEYLFHRSEPPYV